MPAGWKPVGSVGPPLAEPGVTSLPVRLSGASAEGGRAVVSSDLPA